jgi:hypothetical protein
MWLFFMRYWFWMEEGCRLLGNTFTWLSQGKSCSGKKSSQWSMVACCWRKVIWHGWEPGFFFWRQNTFLSKRGWFPPFIHQLESIPPYFAARKKNPRGNKDNYNMNIHRPEVRTYIGAFLIQINNLDYTIPFSVRKSTLIKSYMQSSSDTYMIWN